MEIPDDDSQHVQSPLRIRASSKHLTLASPQFKRTLQEGFYEGSELKSRGYLETEIHDWGAIPFLMLMMIIHGRTRGVPRDVSLVRLAEMATIIDYYECYEVVDVFSDRWIDCLIRSDLSIPFGADVERWLFISWIFQKGKIYEQVTRELQQTSKVEISDEFLPSPAG